MFGNKDTKEKVNPMSTSIPPAPAAPSPRNQASKDQITAYLGPDIEIEGTLRFESSVLIEGRFRGQIESENGTLVVGESAEVEADIRSGHITIRGKVKGSVTATQRVHLQDRGAFQGDLTTPSLQMDESVTFEGSCSMPRPGQSAKTTKTVDTRKNVPDEEKILDAVKSVR